MGLGIDDYGQVTGESTTTNGNVHAFLYSGGTMTDLGTLGGTISTGYGINDSGQVTGSSETATGRAAFLYTDGTMYDLNDLASGNMGGFINLGTGFGINSHGWITGQGQKLDGSVDAFLAKPAPHPAFFNGETALGGGWYYLQFANGTPFGYYSYLADQHYVYHIDMGYEYWFDANDGQGGIYFYDFTSNDFAYTSPSSFPYLYDFSLNAWLYYLPDVNNPGHYTHNPRWFYNFTTGQWITG
jgi:probable HAF family extracellular repeat protein